MQAWRRTSRSTGHTASPHASSSRQPLSPSSPSPSDWSATSWDRRSPSPPPSYSQASRPSLNKLSLDLSYRITLTTDLSFCIVSTAGLFEKIRDHPLRGDWVVEVAHKEGTTRVIFDHGFDLPEGLFGKDVKTVMSLFWLDGAGKAHLVRDVEWTGSMPSKRTRGEGIAPGHAMVVQAKHWERAEEDSGGEYDPYTHREYRFTVKLEQAYPDEDRETEHKGTSSMAMAEMVSKLSLGLLDVDTRFFFPNVGGGAELWARSKVLTTSSPYFRCLFDVDDQETSQKAKEPAKTNYADSDDETDTFQFSKHPPPKRASSFSATAEHHEVVVTDAAYSTYRVVLGFLEGGDLPFLPLSSSFPLTESDETHTEFLEAEHQLYPRLPLPVSCKSVYRLASRLEIPDLKARALEAFSRRLTVDNVTHELFVGTEEGELRKAVVKFVKEHAEEVRGTKNWKEKVAEVEAGKIEGTAPILLALMREGLKL